jgi:diacylglycerol O-acyltransferase
MKQLSGLDAVFLHSETPSMPMNVLATIVLGGGSSESLGFDSIVDRVEQRLSHLAPFRRRMVETPLGLDQPVWIEDGTFDVLDHVMRTVAQAPGGSAELERSVARIAERPLERTRPLWELWVVEGLSDGRVALVTKVHHALLDGVSGAALLLHLFDRPFEPGVELEADPWQGEAEPSPLEMISRAAGRLVSRTTRAASAAREAGGSIARLVGAGLSAGAPVRDAALPFTAPATSFNRALSSRRSIAYARTPLDRIATIREAFGGTLNDVVLTACTTALREYLIARDELPDAPLVASIPISTRELDDEPGGNRVSAMLTELPVHIDETMHRYGEVCRSAQSAKHFHSLLGNHTVEALAEITPGALVGGALRLYSRWRLASLHRPLHNLIISNVPGPPIPLSFEGAPVEALHPHGPLMEGAGLNITVMSYAGSLDVGVLACRESVPEVGLLATAVARAVDDLAELAEHELATNPARRPEGAKVTPIRVAG